MAEVPFAKISINDICTKCDMNRKSFYYHFKDKYDLVNWIFDTECMTTLNKDPSGRRIDILLELSNYFYENHLFYRSALQVRGQNSFLDHFHELVSGVVKMRLEEAFRGKMISEFYVNCLTDGFICAVIRWMEENEPIPPEQFVDNIFIFVKGVSFYISDFIKEKQSEES